MNEKAAINIEKNNTERNNTGKLKYLVTGIIFVVISILFMWNDGIFIKETTKDVFGSISNGFFITGGLFTGIGALSYIGSKGTYDSLSYGVSKIGVHHLIPGMPKDIPESFYDYKMAKEEKGRIWFPNLFFTGLIGILISVIFLVIYSIV